MVWKSVCESEIKVNTLGTAMKIIGQKDHYSLQSLYEQCVLQHARSILNDPSHILYSQYELLPSGRGAARWCSG